MRCPVQNEKSQNLIDYSVCIKRGIIFKLVLQYPDRYWYIGQNGYCFMCMFLLIQSIAVLWLYQNARNLFEMSTYFIYFWLYSKTCVKQPLLKRRNLVFKTNYRLMQVKSYHLSLRSLFCLFLSGCSTQVLLYAFFLCIQINFYYAKAGFILFWKQCRSRSCYWSGPDVIKLFYA